MIEIREQIAKVANRFRSKQPDSIRPVDSGLKEPLSSVESELRSMINALKYAVSHSHGAAIVNVGDMSIDLQGQLSDQMAYEYIQVAEILDNPFVFPANVRRLIVGGYSRDLAQNPDQEKLFQGYIRQLAEARELNAGRFFLVVLSCTMPDEVALYDPSFPWMNGPFVQNESVWSATQTEEGIRLAKFTRKRTTPIGDNLDDNFIWAETESHLFD